MASKTKRLVDQLNYFQGNLNGNIEAVKQLLRDLAREVERLKADARTPNQKLKAENEKLKAILQPVLDVKFKLNSGRAATWFAEAVKRGQPSIRVFVSDYENANKAISAVETVQKQYKDLIENPK